MSTTRLSPSYYGYVGSTKDALLIIQEIVHKHLEVVPRRPHERERPNLIKSGNVFVFIEEHSGIKRWTDGIAWSPSRILGRFLVYRELDKFSLSEKDEKKRKRRKMSDEPRHESETRRQIHPSQVPPNIPLSNSSYVFKDQGLIKKTLSLTTTTKDLHMESKEEKQTIHLISYYNADDVLNGKLRRPSETDLKDVSITAALWNAVNDYSLGGKIPSEDEAYYFLDTNYQLQNMSLLQQPPQQHYPRVPSHVHMRGQPQQPPGMRHNSHPQGSYLVPPDQNFMMTIKKEDEDYMNAHAGAVAISASAQQPHLAQGNVVGTNTQTSLVPQHYGNQMISGQIAPNNPMNPMGTSNPVNPGVMGAPGQIGPLYNMAPQFQFHDHFYQPQNHLYYPDYSNQQYPQTSPANSKKRYRTSSANSVSQGWFLPPGMSSYVAAPSTDLGEMTPNMYDQNNAMHSLPANPTAPPPQTSVSNSSAPQNAASSTANPTSSAHFIE